MPFESFDSTADKKSVYLEITRRCNFCCDYCYVRGGPDGSDPMNTQDILTIVEKSINWGAEQITISGGEPFLRSDLLQIINNISNRCRITIITNASLITFEKAIALARLSNICLTVSLDGSSAETNDKHRGNGSYSGTMRGVKNLLKAGLRKQISLSMTITAENCHTVEDYVRFACGLGIGSVIFTPVVLQGRAVGNSSNLILSEDQLKNLYETLHNLTVQYQDKVRISGSIKTALIDRQTMKKIDLPCSVCYSLAIDCEGNIYPCSLMMLPDFNMGNILRVENRLKTIDELICDRSVFYRNIAVKRKNIINECISCHLHDFCASGCMARAFLYSGSLNCPDPECNVFRNLF